MFYLFFCFLLFLLPPYIIYLSLLQRQILVLSLRGETYAVIVICFNIFNHGICLNEWVRASAWFLGVRTSGRSALPRTSLGLIQKYTIKSYKFHLLILMIFTLKSNWQSIIFWRRNLVFSFQIFSTIDFYFELVHGKSSLYCHTGFITLFY